MLYADLFTHSYVTKKWPLAKVKVQWETNVLNTNRRVLIHVKNFHYFAKVEISHGRPIVRDTVEGRLTTFSFIKYTFTVYDFNEVHSVPT